MQVFLSLSCRSQATGHRSPVSSYRSQVRGHRSQPAPHRVSTWRDLLSAHHACRRQSLVVVTKTAGLSPGHRDHRDSPVDIGFRLRNQQNCSHYSRLRRQQVYRHLRLQRSCQQASHARAHLALTVAFSHLQPSDQIVGIWFLTDPSADVDEKQLCKTESFPQVARQVFPQVARQVHGA